MTWAGQGVGVGGYARSCVLFVWCEEQDFLVSELRAVTLLYLLFLAPVTTQHKHPFFPFLSVLRTERRHIISHFQVKINQILRRLDP